LAARGLGLGIQGLGLELETYACVICDFLQRLSTNFLQKIINPLYNVSLAQKRNLAIGRHFSVKVTAPASALANVGISVLLSWLCRLTPWLR